MTIEAKEVVAPMLVIAFELVWMRNIKYGQCVAFTFNLRSQLLAYCFVSRQRWGKVVVEYGLGPCQRCYTLAVQNIRLATTFAFIPVGRPVCSLYSYKCPKRRKKSSHFKLLFKYLRASI